MSEPNHSLNTIQVAILRKVRHQDRSIQFFRNGMGILAGLTKMGYLKKSIAPNQNGAIRVSITLQGEEYLTRLDKVSSRK